MNASTNAMTASIRFGAVNPSVVTEDPLNNSESFQLMSLIAQNIGMNPIRTSDTHEAASTNRLIGANRANTASRRSCSSMCRVMSP